jgi:succinyl-CoA synthetase alpha subunit
VYKNMGDAMKKHPDADVLINFASLRSAYESTIETLQYPQIRCIAIIAEGIPEQLTRRMNRMARDRKVVVIGPATVRVSLIKERACLNGASVETVLKGRRLETGLFQNRQYGWHAG